ncbi:MAG: HNH endonuclease, partial [Prevotella sp.]|nr:HNH endonuclease [Prevotella sp.]
FFLDVEGHLRGFDNLSQEQKEKFLNYPLQIYICEDGTDTEQLDWFKIINIAGETLTDQEMRNAVYTGPWITDAKLKFSKTNCVARLLGERYMSGSPIRQDYLETVLRWISNGNIKEYMAEHQHDDNADREWQYFQRVIAWVESLFPREHYRREMRGLAWGELYNKYKDIDITASFLESEVERLMMDDDVTNKRGIYDYVLSHDERKLNIRAFSPAMKRAAYERQKGICSLCGQHFEFGKMQGDHIVPWSKGGTTTADNCQMLCQRCNATRGNN